MKKKMILKLYPFDAESNNTIRYIWKTYYRGCAYYLTRLDGVICMDKIYLLSGTIFEYHKDNNLYTSVIVKVQSKHAFGYYLKLIG